MLTASDLSSVQSLLPYASVEEMRRLRRIIAQDSPAGFAATASRGRWILARHLELLNQKLLDVALGRTRRLIISMPPRHGKSEATSKYFPAWYLGRFPDRRIILASYESDFAASWGRKVRDLIDTHGPEFFGVKVRADSSAANRWDLDGHEGGMVTAGVGGPIVGRGANCLSEETIIKTDLGDIDIECLVRLQYRGRVLSYCHHTGHTEWRRVMAAREVQVDDVFEIETGGGRHVRATGEHRFYVCGRGYRPAALLAPGDRFYVCSFPVQQGVRPVRSTQTGPGGDVSSLLSGGPGHQGCPCLRLVSEVVRQAALRIRESLSARYRSGVLLLARLFAGASCRQKRAALPPVSEAHAGAPVGGILLAGMQESGPAYDLQDTTDLVSDLCRRVHSTNDTAGSLLGGVCRPGALETDDRGGEFAFQGRFELYNVVRHDATVDSRPGRLGVLGLPVSGSLYLSGQSGQGDVPVYACGSSRQRGRTGQQSGKSADLVQAVPYGSSQVEEDTVAVVRRVRTPGIRVYDLEVEGNHNFFANEILTHNCLILDDPIKNAAESNSPVIRQRHRDWWRSTAYTRLEPDGAAIVMCTRWNEEDLPGWLIAEVSTGDGEPWDVLNLPALAEENDPLGRAPGEALWPERFSVERLNEIHQSLGSYWFAALYQQRPAPISGGMFHIGEIAIVDALPVSCRMVRYWDKAGTAGGGAFSAGVLMARAADGRFYIADIVRGQWSAGEREKTIKQTAELDGRHVTVWMEQEPGSGGKESAESTIRNLAGWNVHAETVTGDKETRARPFAAQVEAGNVAMLRKPWNKAFIDEAALFPFGKYKDQIDAAAGGFNKLAPVPSQGPAIVGGKRDAAKLVIR